MNQDLKLISKKEAQIFENILELIEKHSNIIILGHVRPDGDCIGSQIGLLESLKLAFPDKNIWAPFAKTDLFNFLLPKNYDNRDNFNDLLDPLFIVLDVAKWERLPIQLNGNEKIIRIDHHILIDDFGTFLWIDSKRPSTCEMVFLLLNYLNLPINQITSNALLTGMITDTGNFVFPLTTFQSFLIASKLMEKEANLTLIHNSLEKKSFLDIRLISYIYSHFKIVNNFVYCIFQSEDYKHFPTLNRTQQVKKFVNIFRNFENCEIWAIFVQFHVGDVIECSIRSQTKDVSKIANQFQGGGHAQASGVKLKNLTEAKELIKKLGELSNE